MQRSKMTLKMLIVCLAALGVAFCFDKLVENIKKIHRHEDEELSKFTGDEYMEKVSSNLSIYIFIKYIVLYVDQVNKRKCQDVCKPAAPNQFIRFVLTDNICGDDVST